MKDLIIYQIFSGRWEKRVNEHESFLDDLKSRNWKNLSDIGFNTVYLMGVWEHQGPIILWDEEGKDLHGLPRVSSMMAITDHLNVDSRLGKMKEFNELVDMLHMMGLKVIVDFVPNHTATTHPWVSAHPEYYYHYDNDQGRFVSEFSGDVHKLNYENPDLRNQMTEILMHIVDLKIDGVRCDMAHLIPNYFWSQAIGQVKDWHPEFRFIAEAYPHNQFDYQNIKDLCQTGFDAVYNVEFFKHINRILVNREPLEYLAANIRSASENIPIAPVNFFANHDDPPLDMRNEPLMSQRNDLFINNLEALTALTLFTPGFPFFYNGSLLGFNHRLAHHWYEYLPINSQEVEIPMQSNLIKLFTLRKEFSPANNYCEIKNTLLVLENDHFKVVINMTEQEQPLNHIQSKHRGLVHDYNSDKDQIKPGEAEVFT